MTNYEELLDNAYTQVKKSDTNGSRFEIPKVEGRFEGKKTIFTNKYKYDYKYGSSE